ncbi:hypothetical protein [Nocardia sp.]|uniref:hypothetical protein n=1 Tax=Nocardia sp. TaxID=1821 RepID=UPI002601BAE7|nr:hypothetical protein [Nocardia sp.]
MSESALGDVHDAETYRVLDDAWNSWGRLGTDMIANLINPAFIDGPSWPAFRQALTIARRDEGLLVASSGLADPMAWNGARPTNGYEVEVFGISADLPADSDTMTAAVSWLGQTVMTVSNLVAQYGFEVPDTIARDGLITIELADARIPEQVAGTYLDDNSTVIVMAGLTDTEVPAAVAGPLSEIRLVNVKLLTVAEGRFCVHNSMGEAAACRELARRFAEQGRPLWSSLDRPSVV